MAILLANFVWEGTSLDRASAEASDGHIFKELDTGESYIRRNGAWENINLGLAFIKATKSGRVTTGAGGLYHVTFTTPFIDANYTVQLSCQEMPTKEIPVAVKDNLATTGFDIVSYNTVKKAVEAGVVVSWLATRDYNP